MAVTSMPRVALRVMLGRDVCAGHHKMGMRTRSPCPPHNCLGCPLHCTALMVLDTMGSLCTADVLSPSCTENGYTSTDEEVSEFSLASDGR